MMDLLGWGLYLGGVFAAWPEHGGAALLVSEAPPPALPDGRWLLVVTIALAVGAAISALLRLLLPSWGIPG